MKLKKFILCAGDRVIDVKKYLEAGKIVNTHGVDGAVKVESWCDSPDILASLKSIYIKSGEDYKELEVIRSFVKKQFAVLFLCGIDSFEKAAAMRNKIIYADREDIPVEEGAVLVSDIIGLPVIDADSGVVYGVLSDVLNLGAGDIYEIDTDHGKAMMPAVKEFVINIDYEKGIFVRPIEGMFE